MSSESSRLSRSWIQKLLLMQQDVFPFGAGDTWQHAAGAVASMMGLCSALWAFTTGTNTR